MVIGFSFVFDIVQYCTNIIPDVVISIVYICILPFSLHRHVHVPGEA